MAGELGVCLEAFDRADLAEQFGGAQGAAAGQRQQRRRGPLDPGLQLAVEGEDRAGEAAAAAEELARDPDEHRLLLPSESPANAVEPDSPVERTRRDDQLRVELV